MGALKPREMQRITFKLSVPAATDPGDYFAWIFAEPEDPLTAASPTDSVANATHDTQFALKMWTISESTVRTQCPMKP